MWVLIVEHGRDGLGSPANLGQLRGLRARLRKSDLAWSLEISVETGLRILDEKQLSVPGTPGVPSETPS